MGINVNNKNIYIKRNKDKGVKEVKQETSSSERTLNVSDFSNPSEYLGRSQVVFGSRKKTQTSDKNNISLSKKDCEPIKFTESKPIYKEEAINMLKSFGYSDDEISQIDFNEQKLKQLGGLKGFLDTKFIHKVKKEFLEEIKNASSEKKLEFINEELTDSMVLMNNTNIELVRKYFDVEPDNVFSLLDRLYDYKSDEDVLKNIPLAAFACGKLPSNDIYSIRNLSGNEAISYENAEILKRINEVLPDENKLPIAQCSNLSKDGKISQETVEKYISHLQNFKDAKFIDIDSLKPSYEGKDLNELNEMFDNIKEKLEKYPMDFSMSDDKKISAQTLNNLLNRQDIQNVQKYINSLSKEAKIAGINHIPQENSDFEKSKTAEICNTIYSKDYGRFSAERLFEFLDKQKENDYKDIDGILGLIKLYKGTGKLDTSHPAEVLLVANGDYEGAQNSIKLRQQIIEDGLNFSDGALNEFFKNPETDFDNVNKILSFMRDEKIKFYSFPEKFFSDTKGYNKLFLYHNINAFRYNDERNKKMEQLAEKLDTQDELDYSLKLINQKRYPDDVDYHELRFNYKFDDIGEIMDCYKKDSEATKYIVDMKTDSGYWRFNNKDTIISIINSYIDNKDLTDELINLKTEKGNYIITNVDDFENIVEATKADKDFTINLLKTKDELSEGRKELRFSPETVAEIVKASAIDKNYVEYLLSLKEKDDYDIDRYRVRNGENFIFLTQEAQKDKEYVDLLMNSKRKGYDGTKYRFPTSSVINILKNTTPENKDFIKEIINKKIENYNSSYDKYNCNDVEYLAKASCIDMDLTQKALNETFKLNGEDINRFRNTLDILDLVKASKKDPDFTKYLLNQYEYSYNGDSIPRFDGDDIAGLVNLIDKNDKETIKTLVDMQQSSFYDGKLTPRFKASDIGYLLGYQGDDKKIAMELINEYRIDKFGNKQYLYNSGDIDPIVNANKTNKDYTSLLLEENKQNRRYQGYDIGNLAQAAMVNPSLTDKLRFLKSNAQKYSDSPRFDTWDIRNIVTSAKNDIAEDDIINLAKMTTVDKKGNVVDRFSDNGMLNAIQCLRNNNNFTKKLLNITTVNTSGQKVPLYTAQEISDLVNSLTEEKYEKIRNTIGSVIEQLPAKDIIVVSDFLDFYQIPELNAVPLARKKALLKALIASNADLFNLSPLVKENFPLIPNTQEEYCSTLPAIVRSIGIETNDLNEKQIKEFNDNLNNLSSTLKTLPNKEFNDLEISQTYSKDEFITDVLNKLSQSNISDYEKQKVFDYYGFELHKNPETTTGYAIVGYPVNLNNGKKLAEIKKTETKRVVESLRENVIKFSENNKITSNNKDIECYLNNIVNALPELRTTIGRKQHDFHNFDVMKHSLKVMQNITQNPEFDTLNESDKKIMLLAALMHDITKAEGVTDPTHANESSFDTFFITKKFHLSKDEEIKLYKLINSHEWLAYIQHAEGDSDTQKRMQSVAFDLQQNNIFDLSYMFTKADLQAIKKTEHHTINRFLHNAEETAPKVKEYVNELKKSQPLLPVTKMPKSSRIEKAITHVNPDGSTNIKGVYKDKSGLIVVKFNEVEEWEKLGLPKGSTTKGIKVKTIDNENGKEVEGEAETGNIKFFVHGLDYSNQLAKFDAFSLINSDALLSVSYAERPETKYRFFRPQGIMLDVQSDYVYGGGNTDSGSGCGKDINTFKNEYIFGGHRENDRLYVSNMVKEETGMSDDEYVKFFNENKDKSMIEIEPENIRTKLIQKFATINSNHRKGNRAYNEMYISNPKEIMGVFAYEMDEGKNIDSPLQFLEDNDSRTDFLKKYALEHDIPFYIFGD